MMDPSDDVTEWIGRAKTGDADAARKLWTRYVHRLVDLAQKKLPHRFRRAEDEEDVVQSVFKSFFQRAEAGQFPLLEDRDDLWSLLVVITHRKSINQSNRERAEKRGGGHVRGESVFGQQADGGGLDIVLGSDPTPDFALEVAENFEKLLETLGTDVQRRVACLRMEGYTIDEIAQELGSSARSVARKIALIRTRLEESMGR